MTLSYRVYRDGAFIGTAANPTYTDSGLVNGHTYSYQVSAVNAVGEGPLTPIVTATPVSGSLSSVTVSSIAAIKSNLTNNSLDEIVVTDGTYSVAGASSQSSNSLWIDSTYAGRTRPITIRAQSTHGVTLDGGGSPGGIFFNSGCHDQVWDGFRFTNSVIGSSGLMVFGGYPNLVAPYNITLRNFLVERTVTKYTLSSNQSHAVYFSYATNGGPHDILIENMTHNAQDAISLWSTIHMDHGYSADYPNVAAHNVTVRNLTTDGTNNPIILWQPPTHDWLFDGAVLSNALDVGIRFESIGASNIVFKNITSTNSKNAGFYSSLGANPPGVTFQNCNLH